MNVSALSAREQQYLHLVRSACGLLAPQHPDDEVSRRINRNGRSMTFLQPLGALDLPGEVASVAKARRYVRQVLSGVDHDRINDAVLLVSELITNAVTHSDSGRTADGRVGLVVANRDGVIRVDVFDEGSATSWPQVRKPSKEERSGGFGLWLVERLASDWDHYDHDEGRVVWFELDPPWEDPENPDNAQAQGPTGPGMMPPERTELTPDAWSQRATIPPEIATPTASGRQPLPVRTGRDLRVPLSRVNGSEASPPTRTSRPDLLSRADRKEGSPPARTSRADPPSRADRNEARSPARTGGPHGAVIALRRREIIDNLAAQIASGELEEGARVASVRRLMDAYSIPASAARSIQRELRDRRIIRLVPGLGYVVGAPDRTPKPPRIPVQDQITQIATSLAKKIASGQIGTHQPVATLRGLMIEHAISREAASAVLSRLRSRGWAYDTPYQTTRAAPRHKWPPPGTSLTNPPPPADHLPKSRRPKARPPPDAVPRDVPGHRVPA